MMAERSINEILDDSGYELLPQDFYTVQGALREARVLLGELMQGDSSPEDAKELLKKWDTHD